MNAELTHYVHRLYYLINLSLPLSLSPQSLQPQSVQHQADRHSLTPLHVQSADDDKLDDQHAAVVEALNILSTLTNVLVICLTK